MTNQELEKYRIQLFRDAAGMEKKPDRTPLVSFFVTWKLAGEYGPRTKRRRIGLPWYPSS